MRDKFNKFMQGRYGVDELSRFTMGAALVLIILTMFITMFNRNLGSIFDFGNCGDRVCVFSYFFQKYSAALCGEPEISSDDIEVPASFQ